MRWRAGAIVATIDQIAITMAAANRKEANKVSIMQLPEAPSDRMIVRARNRPLTIFVPRTIYDAVMFRLRSRVNA